MKVSIYVACHKKFKKPFPGHFFLKYIEVGRFYHNKGFLRLNDNAGNSISYKNANYNELTALYWVWKNDQKSDICGLCHYRRYFLSPTSKSHFTVNRLLKPKEIKHILRENDIIAVPVGPFGISCLDKPPIGRTFRSRINDTPGWVKPEDINAAKEIIFNLYGEKYCDAFEKILDRNWNYMLNMLICKKQLFDAYCAWLFPILDEMEKIVDLDKREGPEKRIFGFIGEYLLNVYIAGQNLKVCGVKHIEKEASLWHSFIFKTSSAFKRLRS